MIQFYVVSIFIYSPTDIETVSGITVLVIEIRIMGNAQIGTVVSAVIRISECRGTVEFDITRGTHVE